MFHPYKLIRSSLLQPIFEASLASLELQSVDPLNAVLQFLRDVLAYGRASPPTSAYPDNPTAVQDAVKAMALNKGEAIIQKILSGLMYSFPRDCVPDSSGVLLALVELCPEPWLQWMKRTLEILPAGSISPTEAQKFLKTLEGCSFRSRHLGCPPPSHPSRDKYANRQGGNLELQCRHQPRLEED